MTTADIDELRREHQALRELIAQTRDGASGELAELKDEMAKETKMTIRWIVGVGVTLLLAFGGGILTARGDMATMESNIGHLDERVDALELSGPAPLQIAIARMILSQEQTNQRLDRMEKTQDEVSRKLSTIEERRYQPSRPRTSP